MQLFDKTLFIEFYSRYCRRYQKLALTLIGAICIMLAMFSGNQLAQDKKESNKKVLMVKLPDLVLNPTHELSQDKQAVTIAKIDTQESTTVPLAPIPPLASVATKQVKDIYKKVTVKNGDTLAKIFSSVGISSAELQNILRSDKTSKQLISIKPGQALCLTKIKHYKKLLYQLTIKKLYR
jgi:LysM repeat protein